MTTAQAPSIEELRATATEKEVAVTAAEAKLAIVRADSESDLDALMGAAKELQAAKDAHERVSKAVQKANFDAMAGQRESAVEKVKVALNTKGITEALTAAAETGVKGISITFGEDGSVTVTGNAAKAPSGGKGSGGRRGAYTWHYQDTDYTSRELIVAFHEDAEKVLERAAAGAGFDQPVKVLAKKLGATFTKSDGTSGSADEL